MIFVTVDGIADISDKFDDVSNTAPWFAEVVQVWRNGINDGNFSYSIKDQEVSIPDGSDSDEITVKFRLYLISGSAGEVAPKDPTDSMSDLRYWDNRLSSSPSVTRSIDNIERGFAQTQASPLSILLSDDWEDLTNYECSFSNQSTIFYRNSTKELEGIVVSESYNSSSFVLNVQAPSQGLDQLATFGDPDYLVKIDPTHSSSFYNGSDIPSKYHGVVIPMLFGGSTAYDQSGTNTVETGDVNGVPVTAPVIGNITHRSATSPIQCIPISANEVILGKIPSYQTFPTSNGTSFNTSGARDTERVYNFVSSVPVPDIGQLVNLVDTNDGGAIDPGIKLTDRSFYSKQEQPSPSFGYEDVVYPLTFRVYGASANQRITAFPTVSLTATSGGQQLIKLTFPASDDLRDGPPVVVVLAFGGARSGPEVAEYILNSHGISTDSASFTAADLDVPNLVNMYSGSGTTVPKVSSLMKDINNSTFGTVFPSKDLSEQVYALYQIGSVDATITEDEISSLQVSTESRDILSKIDFVPKYATQPELQSTVNQVKESSKAQSIYNITNETEYQHVFQSDAPRFDDIMTHFGDIQRRVEFDYLDDQYVPELGDTVTIDHYNYQGTVFITSITIKDVGVSIKARELKI